MTFRTSALALKRASKYFISSFNVMREKSHSITPNFGGASMLGDERRGPRFWWEIVAIT